MQIQYKDDDLPFFIIVIIIKWEYNNSMNIYLFRLAKKVNNYLNMVIK